MKEGFVKVAAATPRIRLADTAFNADSIISLIKEAKDNNIKLLVLPELCITGATLNDLYAQESLQEKVLEAIEYICKHTKDTDMLIFVGAPLVFRGSLYSTAIAMNEGNILGIIPKMSASPHNRHFKGYNQENSEIVIKGQKYPFGNKIIFTHRQLNSFCVCAELGEDLWLGNSPSSTSTMKGANIVTNLAATHDIVRKEELLQDLIKVHTQKRACGYVFANAGEGESTTDMVFSGCNFIYEYGTCLAKSEAFSTGITLSEIDVEKLDKEKVKQHLPANNACDYKYIDFFTKIERTSLSRKISPLPFIPKAEELEKRTQQILALQANALKQRIEHTKSDYIIVGVSGGLDSTLALLVATKTAKLLDRSAKSVLAVTLPCFGTTAKTLDNATLLAALLNTSFLQVDIKDAVQKHLEDIHHAGEWDTTYENAQARERMQVLMDIANQKNGLVVGTGNLSELALGFTTYNGDHMSMYAINSSIPKTLLKKMVEIYAKSADAKLQKVLLDIVHTPISPELIPSKGQQSIQNTEKIIGPYELHDFFIYYFVRWGFSPRKILRLASYAFDNYTDKEIILWLKLFLRRFFASQFKRSCMPDSPQIGTVSLSPRTNWKMPSDACYQLWLKDLDSL